MPLLNYTTKVPVVRSVQVIQAALVKAGAKSIMQDFDDDGQIVAISFRILLPSPEVSHNFTELNFKLPIDWRACLAIMERDDTPAKLVTEEQARRVAWRIIKDWVEVQLAIVATKMVTLPQVFLPYAVNKDGHTLYEIVANNPNLLLGDGNG